MNVIIMPKNSMFYLKTELGQLQFPISDILYVESQKRIIVFFMQKQARESYYCYGTLSHTQQQFFSYGFCRVHKSYLVNLRHICCVRREELILQDGMRIPIGRHYAKEFIKAYNNG